MTTDSLTGDTANQADSKNNDATMVKVIGVRFRHSKTLWFDPQDFRPQPGDKVIVSTERGTEIGECTQACWEVDKNELPAPLKPVIRIANDEDLHTDKELQDEEFAAIPIFREYIEKNQLDMKPADVEILFGKEKMIFYFSAEERIDFRQLVRDLAAHFHCRIEMRQVGVRDEARMAGGIAHCGEVLCCSRLGGEFAPVSIKMAKDQGLPLNPSKISGVCGRLMCCLRYETDAYRDFNKRAPKKGAIIDTPHGGGKVIERDALREVVKLQFRGEEDNKPGETMKVPLSRMCCKDKRKGKGSKGCGGCPCAIAPDVFAELVEESKQVHTSALSADGLDFRGLSSTQGTESAIDNGKEAAKRPKRPKRGSSRNKIPNKNNKPKAESSEDGDGTSKRSRRRNKGQSKDRKTRRGNKDSGQPKQQNNKGKSKSGSQKSSAEKVETRVPRRRRTQK
ncbi:MAG: stage 0 sporulation family protein [Coriobacteriia bacterium]|nr:stage 0 sporulation family protein [Coriobacteriia bacterium]MCL2745843.1 stage 0 sporulation family protein [Coriobacteriia bacterium]MCL2870223.1 stage 0 sporulation family protein [Coriobacteriia bacterium]